MEDLLVVDFEGGGDVGEFKVDLGLEVGEF